MLATFTATSGNDVIDIFDSSLGFGTRVIINGGASQSTTDLLITINAGGGNDTINVHDTGNNSNITLNGGTGDDFLQNFGSDLDAVYENFTFVGGAGNDLIAADNDQDEADFEFFRIRGDSIVRRGGGFPEPIPDRTLLRYSEVERVQFGDNNLKNVMLYEDLRVGSNNVAVTIFGNGGDDTVHNNNSTPDLGDDIGSAGLHFDGGSGNDSIGIYSTEDTTTNSFVIAANSVDPNTGNVNPGAVTVASCESIQVIGSPFADSFLVNSKLSTASLSVSGSGGNDTFTVGGGDVDSNGFVFANTSFDGGDDADSIRFDDRLDAEGGIETYTLAGATFNGDHFTKGTAGWRYSSFETQALDAADRVTALNVPNTINFNSNSNFQTAVINTTINGGSLRSCLVNIGDGGLGSVYGDFAVNLGAASGGVNLNNQNATADAEYRLTQTQLSVPKVVTYSGASAFNIFGGSGAESFFVDGVKAGTTVNVSAGGGNDVVRAGGGNVAVNLLGTLNANGGAGSNLLFFDNNLDGAASTQALNGATFVDGLSHTFSSMAGLTITAGPGSTSLAINATAVPTLVFGGSGDDEFNVGGGDINSNFQPTTALGIVIDGRSGNDQIVLNDINDSTLDQYIFQRVTTRDQLVKDGTSDFFISWLGMEQATLNASNAPSSPLDPVNISVTDIVTPLRINANAGSDRISIADASAPVAVNSGLGDADQLIVNSDFVSGDAPVSVVIDQSDDLEVLDIRPGGTVRVEDGAVLVKSALSGGLFSIAGVLDLSGGSLLSRAGGPAQSVFQGLLVPGFNSGGWNGVSTVGAINSSLAAQSIASDGVGYGLGSEIAPTSVGGFTIAPGDTLIRYTLNGDADLNGAVNISDFARLAANFNGTNKVWTTGDSNYDAAANISDFASLAANFNQSIPVGLPRTASPTAIKTARFSSRLIDDVLI